MSDVGVYGLVDLDAFQGRDDTIRKAIKKVLIVTIPYVLYVNLCVHLETQR